MLNRCPHCRQNLRFSDEQVSRLEQALFTLDSGKTLTVKCPRCREGIILDKAGKVASLGKQGVQPPPPPDLDWLQTGLFQGEEKVEDVPMALVIHQPTEQRTQIRESLESVGYQVVLAESAANAMERMRFVSFACVVLHESLEGSLDQSTFHAYMRDMGMDRRRYIFYILVGSSFHTLYNLEALAHSANLTVNTTDLRHFDIVLRKAIPVYEELFGPIMEELTAFGKR